MTRRFGFLTAMAVLGCGASSAAVASLDPNDAPASNLPAPVQEHITKAYHLMRGDVSKRVLPAALNVIDGVTFPDPVQQARAYPSLPATKAFDQFYFLGTPMVSAWALDTSDGIILIDTLDNNDEAKTYIEDGMRTVGLDPNRIRYIVVTHAHPDHFGGAKYLAEKYHAHVLMSPVDWALMASYAATPARPGRPPMPPAPTHDVDVVDGQTLKLGDTTVRLYITPGHTPGTVSAIFPVTDHGRPHMVSFLGGAGMASVDKDPAHGGFTALRNSMIRFGKVSAASHTDVLAACHSFMDDSWEKAKATLDHTGGPVSAWIVGTDAVSRYYAAIVQSVDAVETYYTLNPPKPKGAPAPAAN